MSGFWSDVLAGLVIAAVLGGAAWLWKPLRRRIKSAWNDGKIEADALVERAEAEALETLREQVLERAHSVGVSMPVGSVGSRVTYSDGKVSTFIPDFGQYRAAMSSGRVDIHRTYNKSRPVTLAERDRAWMEKWLREHPES